MVEHVAGRAVTNAADGAEILISKRHIKKFFSARNNRVTLAAGTKLDKIIESATPAGRLDDAKGKAGVLGWHYYDRAVLLGNKPARIRVVVEERADAKRY